MGNQPQRMRRLRRSLAALFAIALILPFTGFERFGADCGDAIQRNGTDAFTCNTPAYVLMAVGLIGLTGIVVIAVWTAFDWYRARRASHAR
ncbi:MAG: hypothetical protein QOH76_3436 [Thermoleophilaceae bacterium]|jgi:hypothetical protein|nr:hypothetical protein [Thermoleophilaceae bacterium]